MQIFNQINSRKIKDEYNPFSGIGRGAAFFYILLIELILQVRNDMHLQHGNVLVCTEWCSILFYHVHTVLVKLAALVSL